MLLHLEVFIYLAIYCNLVMVKSKNDIDGNSRFEVHIRTTRICKWSKINTIAVKVGQDVERIRSDDEKFILNRNTVQKIRMDH